MFISGDVRCEVWYLLTQILFRDILLQDYFLPFYVIALIIFIQVSFCILSQYNFSWFIVLTQAWSLVFMRAVIYSQSYFINSLSRLHLLNTLSTTTLLSFCRYQSVADTYHVLNLHTYPCCQHHHSIPNSSNPLKYDTQYTQINPLNQCKSWLTPNTLYHVSLLFYFILTDLAYYSLKSSSSKLSGLIWIIYSKAILTNHVLNYYNIDFILPLLAPPLR